MRSSEKRESQKKSAIAAAGRLFRAYEQHCEIPGADTLFNTLTAAHSLNDRLQKDVGRDFHNVDEFLALKTIRNFAHHQEEVRANVRVIPSPSISDLAFLCIVRRDQVEAAIQSVDQRWRQATKVACEEKFHWYGEAVNINPCLFNFMVHVYELLVELKVDAPADDVSAFETSYRFEVECGYSHFVDGRLTARAAYIEAVLTVVAAELPKR